MPGHGRAHGAGGDEEPARPRFHVTEAHSVRAGEDAVEALARTGRPGNSAAGFTAATGSPGARPEGPSTRIGSKEDDDVRRSLDRENSAAVTMADHGFRVEQNPTPAHVARARLSTGDTGSPESDPDYLIEGRVFDCYSPGARKPVRGIWSEVGEKVLDREQTQRVVVNLADWAGDLAALRMQFAEWPIPGLKEVKVITPSGDIVQLDLHPDND
jgi:Contact-dependent growth inhibition CdiA C-terminal domain